MQRSPASNLTRKVAYCTATYRHVGDLSRGVSAACSMFKGLPTPTAFMTASLVVPPSLVSKHGPWSGQQAGLVKRS